MLRFKHFLIAACILAIAILPGCSSPQEIDETPHVTDEQVMNLQKLCKVWGFTKYTHQAFLSGRKCWDEELLNLIPIVMDASADDVNDILYEWFVGLGDDGFDLEIGYDFDLAEHITSWSPASLAPLEALYEERGLLDRFLLYHEFYNFFAVIVQDGGIDWQSFVTLSKEYFPTFVAAEGVDMHPMADLSWINTEYLGALATHLLRFDGIAALNRPNAPVFFNPVGTPNFSNQSNYPYMDFDDTGYRLLGLFRLWNAMNYYFPHLDVLDVEWNDLLIEFIPKMLEGTDRLSYELTLAAMSHYLQDAHVTWAGATFFADRFGRYSVPVQLIEAEGRLVVYESAYPLTRGDVILGLNGRDIDEITDEMKKFMSFPNEEKALTYIAFRTRWVIAAMTIHPLRSHYRNIEIDILRNDVEMRLNINGVTSQIFAPPTLSSRVLLDNNIGLINPSVQGVGVKQIMESFATTDGIIIDLRQRPYPGFMFEMRQYLMEEPMPFAYMSFPSQNHPGARQDRLINQYITQSPYAFVYGRPVVLLMDEQTFSHPEWVIMSFRTAPNVTVIGPFSMGSNGDVTYLPLPGGITMWFTGLGVYTPDGGQTHRIGLAPDIRVDRTIQGIAEGRDELMEAAIQFILGG